MASLEGWGFTIKLYPRVHENVGTFLDNAKDFLGKSKRN